MGGCYGGSYGYSSGSSSCGSSKRSGVRSSFQKFLKSGDVKDLVSAQKAFSDDNGSGFIAEFAKIGGIADVNDIPKEFPEIEYEVKFDVQVDGKGKEPKVAAYLDAFDFPAVQTARFLKDPVNTFAIGVNHFYGNGDERLVVIEKGGNLYLKEKGPVLPLDVPVQYRDIVIKRTEERWQADFSEVSDKISEVCREGSEYKGRVRKEKGDAFILDTGDGRIYSFTITRAHLVRAGESEESDIQRQLEVEYAGYLPGFSGFEEGSEEQIVRGMVGLAKYTHTLYDGAPISRGWKMNLAPTEERKYDFVSGNGKGRLEHRIGLPELFRGTGRNGDLVVRALKPDRITAS